VQGSAALNIRAEHLRLIGCSDLPALLGRAEPGPVGLYNRCVHGISVPRPRWLEDMGRLGKLTEWPTAIAAAELMGHDPEVVTKRPTIIHPAGRAWQRCSPDPFIPRSPRGPVLFEVKSRASWRLREEGWGEAGTGDVPFDVWVQVQGQMEAIRADRDQWVGTDLPDLERVHVAVLVNGQEVRLYPVDYDRPRAEALAAHAARWWSEHVTRRSPPTMDAYEGSAHYLDVHYPLRSRTEVRRAEPQEVEAVRELYQAEEEFRRAAERRDGLRNELREIIGSELGLYVDGLGEVKSPQRRGRINWEAVARGLAARAGVSERELKESAEYHRGGSYRVIQLPRMRQGELPRWRDEEA